MKRILLFSAIAACMALTSGCGNAAPEKTFTLTKDGVSTLVVGKPFVDNSQSGEEFYNRVEKDRYYDEPSGIYITVYYLFQDDQPAATFLAMDAPNDEIYKLSVSSPQVAAENGVRPGMSVAEALSIPGVKAECSCDLLGEVDCGYTVGASWKLAGSEYDSEWVTFSPDAPECLTAEAQSKCASVPEYEALPLTAADFKPEAKVASINIE